MLDILTPDENFLWMPSWNKGMHFFGATEKENIFQPFVKLPLQLLEQAWQFARELLPAIMV